MSTVFQNPRRELSDHEVYGNELRFADLAEPLGFQSIWGVEHHFTDYTMCPDVIQFLTYMAGRTEKALLGSMVVALPWHDPMRVAEQVSMLDNLSGGRMILGIGRGLARVEFEGFRLEMSESRVRFAESAEMILEGLEIGYCQYDGELIKQPRRDIRPSPFKSFKGRTYAAAVSPESAQIVARLGAGVLIVSQKPWETVALELDEYRETYRQVNGEEAPPPVVVGWTFCDEDEGRAYDVAHRYMGGYWESLMDHYEFKEGHLSGVKGYEYYGKFAEKVTQLGDEQVADFFQNLQVWGTPEQCYEKIMAIHNWTGNDSYVGVFSYAGMPRKDAERSMRLFAEKVMPRLKEFQPAARSAGQFA